LPTISCVTYGAGFPVHWDTPDISAHTIRRLLQSVDDLHGNGHEGQVLSVNPSAASALGAQAPDGIGGADDGDALEAVKHEKIVIATDHQIRTSCQRAGDHCIVIGIARFPLIELLRRQRGGDAPVARQHLLHQPRPAHAPVLPLAARRTPTAAIQY